MQKQSMTRAIGFIASVTAGIFNPFRNRDPLRIGKRHPDSPEKRSFWNDAANPDGYGMSILSSPRYRAYKRKRNRRARGANGGTLPNKYRG